MLQWVFSTCLASSHAANTRYEDVCRDTCRTKPAVSYLGIKPNALWKAKFTLVHFCCFAFSHVNTKYGNSKTTPGRSFQGWFWYLAKISLITCISCATNVCALSKGFTCKLCPLSLSLSQSCLVLFLSSTKMAFRKALTFPIFMVMLMVASIPFVQSSRTREFNPLSLSNTHPLTCSFLYVFYHQRAGLQGRTTMAESTARVVAQVLLTIKSMSKKRER